ncbi:hypothetical protein F2P56_013341 [Juglans regia]|uniref:GAGA-binding transcriptional activator n=2 Tax=Juglans regia TaxID=51240 RepID=A0A2I4DLJ5_JUGRE|nr:protein BASIC PENTACYSTEINE2-like [Juglans regia]XP_018808020.1 protein BASIC PENTACYSTEINE2-like [Juglans regia]KAF5469251.1 hypothetical protein F2P56_013339 [Juglans regia]KAF5469252.1 hypothetical protein F2P56_013340 [Juglans regia]KAF5469253.1 hypothetical protein F2P56_013341 [Juglans regia]
MDGDNSLRMRHWGYYEPARSHLGLQLMSSIPEKPLIGGRNAVAMASGNGAFQHRDLGVSHSGFPMEFVRDAWINQRERYINVLPGYPGYGGLPETSSAHHVDMVLPPDLPKEEKTVSAEETGIEKENGPIKKRRAVKAPKSPKEKKTKRAPRPPKTGSGTSAPRARTATKKTTEIAINGVDMDISGIPIPVCSCTGTPQQCYRWGSGGWQSACCTTAMSMYPLPMSTKRRGARIAGRKMSIGAFKKVLEKLAGEGYNFTNPINLRTYWAKHGTNKFVTIR